MLRASAPRTRTSCARRDASHGHTSRRVGTNRPSRLTPTSTPRASTTRISSRSTTPTWEKCATTYPSGRAGPSSRLDPNPREPQVRGHDGASVCRSDSLRSKIQRVPGSGALAGRALLHGVHPCREAENGGLWVTRSTRPGCNGNHRNPRSQRSPRATLAFPDGAQAVDRRSPAYASGCWAGSSFLGRNAPCVWSR